MLFSNAQKDVKRFRYKLASILIYWKTNTANNNPNHIQDDDTGYKSDDVAILANPNDIEEFKNKKQSLSSETRYRSLMSVVSMMGVHELIGGLCSYIKSIDCKETLEKLWVQSSKPYSIRLNINKLKQILMEDQPIDLDCFNLSIRTFVYEDIHKAKKTRGPISKHYMDLQFWMSTDFGRHPDFTQKLNIEQLAMSVCQWPGMNYNVLRCKSILIPIQFYGTFILIILDQTTKIVYIIDPNPINPIYENNPYACYVPKISWIAKYLPKAMAKAYPGSRWNEHIDLWRHIIVPHVQIHNNKLSGYLVSLFMRTWSDNGLQLPDGYELRKQFLAKLLVYQENECENNMPEGIREFITCIRNK
uniref:Ubiquitin-like protease family profile domain-containing protein n=1 Tax=Leersia perrieri TaxID=77586 RepID=A0A0D9WHM0_9ORYZ